MKKKTKNELSPALRRSVPGLGFLLTLICSLIILFPQAALAEMQAPLITIEASNEPLKDILTRIEVSQGYLFNYADRDVSGQRATINITDAPIGRVMDMLLAGTGLTFTVTGRHVAIRPAPDVSKQKVTISGRVTDDSGDILIGATVSEKGTTNGTVTGPDGRYRLEVFPNSTINVSYIGYEEHEENIGVRSVLDITLTEKRTELEELVVVGYRTVKKVSLTGSVATISMARKEAETITDASQVLYSTPGIWVNQGGAQPGVDGASVRIRGINSLNSTGGSPLVLLDGVEYDMGAIDPNTIESVSVLKDVSAAIYGSKASNGVILFTSKKGEKGRPRVEYRGHGAIQKATSLPDVISDPILYMRMRNQAEINSGIAPSAVSYQQSQIDEYIAGMATDPMTYPSSDWLDICFKNGYVQQHNVRVTGGGDVFTYTVGAGYMQQEGVFLNNDNARKYSFDLKMTAKVSDRLDISGSVQGTLRKWNEVGYGTEAVMRTILRGLPIFSDYHDGGYRYGSTWLFTPGRNNPENPRSQVEQGYMFRDQQEFLATLGFDYKLPADITYHATLAYRKVDRFTKDFMPRLYMVNPKTGDETIFAENCPRVRNRDYYNMQYSISHRLVWERDYGKHNVHLMVGHDFQDIKLRNSQAFNYGFNDNSLTELSALTDQTNAYVSGDSSLDRLISVYGRAAYDYDGKYLAEATFRYDGSNRLAKGHRWAFFPSFLAGWRIDREGFFDLRPIDMLKLRASVGQMGSQSVPLYSSLMTIGPVSPNYSFGGTVATSWAASSLVDETLGWETTTAYNLGIDLSMLGNRLSFSGDLFYKRTKDILRTVIIPTQVGGLSGPKSNVGVVDNKGYELFLAWRDSKGSFSYGVNGSVSFVKNKVVKLRNEQQISGNFITLEGHPINSFYLYNAVGYYQSFDEINDAGTVVYGSRSRLKPGYVKYENRNGDNVINEQDKVIVGNSMPKYTYTFGFNIGYKGLSLETQFQGVGKVFVYPTANIAVPFNNGAGVTWEWANDSWTYENRNSKLPLLTTYTDAPENFIPSTQWLRNASYLRMKNIQLSYKFPSRVANALRMENLTVYVSGQNLLTFTNFKLWDPEITTTRGDLYEYPNLKSFSFGINITF